MRTSLNAVGFSLGIVLAAGLSLLLGTSMAIDGLTPLPNLAANLGIATATAKKAIDLIFTFWGFAAAVALTGGWTAALLVVAKSLAKRYGRAWATAW